jgi:aminoglycoside phosphotransferase (APT) family kinase protein
MPVAKSLRTSSAAQSRHLIGCRRGDEVSTARYPGPVASLDGLDLAALDRHLRATGIPRAGALRAELISGGRSNLTFLVFDDTATWVLRRPPLHGLTPSAHDMAREHRVVAALAGTPVPVPRVVTMRDGDSVLSAPFQMVDYVLGRVVRSRADLEALGDTEVIDGCVDALIRVLADLHTVDPQAVGLGDFGKPSGYLQRQVRRWGSQWQHVRLPDDYRDDDVERLTSRLSQSIPQQTRTSIVHGDYRIDNVILDYGDPTVVRAVVDWELSTLGDPLADVALMCVYRDPALDLIINEHAAWTSPLLASADELAHRYSVVSGQPLAHWEFYMSLAYFKLAIIAAGIDFRRRMAADTGSARRTAPASEETSDRVGETVAPLIANGLKALGSRL